MKLYNDTAKQDNRSIGGYYDSDHKLLAKFNNIYMTKFKAGWMFDEITGKQKELFKILNVPVPTVEQVIEVEASEEEMDGPSHQENWNTLIRKDEAEDLYAPTPRGLKEQTLVTEKICPISVKRN